MDLTTSRVRRWATPPFIVFMAITTCWIWLDQHERASTQQALTAQRGSLASDVDTLRSQVRYCRAHPRASYCRAPAAPDPSVRISQHPAKPVVILGQPGQDGATGQHGADGQRGAAATDQQTQDAVRKYMALHPISDGQDGQPGRNGTDGLTPACYSLPTQCVGPPGRDGKDGSPGKDGQPGRDGAPGQDGRDGLSITSTDINPDTCHLIITYSNGRTQDAGQTVCPATAPDTTPATPGGT